MKPPPPLPRIARDVVRRLRGAGLPAYVVGGAVRDALLGRPVRDVDLLVDADLAAAARALPEAIVIEARARVLALPAGGGEPRVEISSPRPGAADAAADLCLRDFTLNAIAFDPEGGRYLDPSGGLDDLAARRLRCFAPERTIAADPVRILRGARLESELGLETERATEYAFERAAALLVREPGERLREELLRLLGLPAPAAAVERLRRRGALAAVLPEALRGVGIEQNRHHREDVYRHTLSVCDLVRPEPTLRLAALLHDAAKPETKERGRRDGGFTFHRHELAARPHVSRVARRLRLSRREERRVGELVHHHLLFPGRLATPAARRRLLRRVGPELLPDLLDLRRADLAARHPAQRPPPEWIALEARLRELLRETAAARPPRPALSGRQVMDALGIGEGPEVGRWLRRIQRRILERPEENRPERLLRWLREASRAEDVSAPPKGNG